ncbi:MAG: hypothetical protein B7Z73_14925, partial [Planctomycetia bacterium 21-64-5]
LTPEDLEAIRSTVRKENIELAEAIADVMGNLIKPLADRLTEVEKALIALGGDPWRNALSMNGLLKQPKAVVN